jgi:ABC-type phosphate transport system substrate-binding protein
MKILLLFLLLSNSALLASAEIVVIGNLDNELTSLTKKQVQEIFLGRTRTYSNGIRALPFDVPDLRIEFYEKLTNRPIEQINAYWARLIFSGRASPPSDRPDQKSVINTVKNAKGVIAYIERKQLDETQIKLLYVIE